MQNEGEKMDKCLVYLTEEIENWKEHFGVKRKKS